jgi:hypothetical protein
MMLGAIAKMRNSIGGQVLVLVKTPRPDRRDSRLIEFLSKYENHKSLKKDEQKSTVPCLTYTYSAVILIFPISSTGSRLSPMNSLLVILLLPSPPTSNARLLLSNDVGCLKKDSG